MLIRKSFILFILIFGLISAKAEEDLDFLFDTPQNQGTQIKQNNKTIKNPPLKENEKNFQKDIENQQNENNTYEYGFQIEDDSWMDKYFLVERINLLLILANHIKDLGITLEQLEQIRSFYEEYHPVMVAKAKLVASKEENLKDLVLHGGDPRKIKELVIVIAKLKAELTVYNIKIIRVIQNTLTKEQYENLLTIYQKSII